ncbi:MAG TPA: hypothetical protein VJH03_17630 [Blastocatellia bacterium]|nr:hypothetical protein [Blastocatellia bacterium]
MNQNSVGHEGTPPVCAICQSLVGPDELKTACPDCHTGYHVECWEENKGCAIYGCAQVPPTEHREALEIPASYWGQEHKPCPACDNQILAAAVRCRHCGAMFSSGRPEDPLEFRKRSEINERLPKLKRTIVCLFILCALPCAAPFAAVFGLIWYSSNRDAIKAMPALYSGLCKIALGVGIGQSALAVFMVILFAGLKQ